MGQLRDFLRFALRHLIPEQVQVVNTPLAKGKIKAVIKLMHC
jgi:hypothetical protein